MERRLKVGRPNWAVASMSTPFELSRAGELGWRRSGSITRVVDESLKCVRRWSPAPEKTSRVGRDFHIGTAFVNGKSGKPSV